MREGNAWIAAIVTAVALAVPGANVTTRAWIDLTRIIGGLSARSVSSR